jgi:hypothetical protein
MKRAIVYQLALFLSAVLCPGLVLALSETYEGQLIPRTYDSPIPIVVQMEELGGFLSGKVRTSLPIRADANIDSGRIVAGYCNLTSALTSSITLRLYGDCSNTSFEGYFTMYSMEGKVVKNVVQGSFRLTRKVSQSGKAGSGLATADIAASNLLACVKANTRCLAACPRGDTDVEYLCANHCRTKMNACKAKANKPDGDSDSP